ncbi:MAG TPA: hypothetical protein VIJ96_20230 [Acidothermaceae bacterium]
MNLASASPSPVPASLTGGPHQGGAGWAPANTIAVVAVGVALLSPLIAYWVQRMQWRRDRRADTYGSVVALHDARRRWRNAAAHLMDDHPDTGSVSALLELFGTNETRALGSEASKQHIAAVVVLLGRRQEVEAKQRPLSMTPEQIRDQMQTADEAEKVFLARVIRELRLTPPD